MEFGRIPEKELKKIDFALPTEPLENKEILSGRRVALPKVYIGCSKWGRNEWVGKIYPPKTKEKDFLEHYGNNYNSIELNTTHYKIYDARAVRKWAEKTEEKGFLYCPKMYQGVTHNGNLLGKDEYSNDFFAGLRAFREQLGPIFIQLSETFSPKRMLELFEYLKSLPTDLQFFLEVRHPDFFNNPTTTNELFSFLQEHKIGAVITDTSGRRDCAHMRLSIPKVFIRYVGNSLHPTDYKRIDDWIKRIKYWLDEGVQEVFFFMHMHDEAYSPELTVYMVDKLNAACGLNLKKPVIVKKGFSLF